MATRQVVDQLAGWVLSSLPFGWPTTMKLSSGPRSTVNAAHWSQEATSSYSRPERTMLRAPAPVIAISLIPNICGKPHTRLVHKARLRTVRTSA